jgi:hypothetical protein
MHLRRPSIRTCEAGKLFHEGLRPKLDALCLIIQGRVTISTQVQQARRRISLRIPNEEVITEVKATCCKETGVPSLSSQKSQLMIPKTVYTFHVLAPHNYMVEDMCLSTF